MWEWTAIMARRLTANPNRTPPVMMQHYWNIYYILYYIPHPPPFGISPSIWGYSILHQQIAGGSCWWIKPGRGIGSSRSLCCCLHPLLDPVCLRVLPPSHPLPTTECLPIACWGILEKRELLFPCPRISSSSWLHLIFWLTALCVPL